MPSSVRPRGSGGGRAPPVTPMSERQQMALLMQMTSAGNQQGSPSPSGSAANPRRERNERGETPLHLAAIKGDVEQVSKLLAHRVDPNVTDFAGWTPLHEACNHGWLEVAARLVASGANVNARGLDDDTPLHDAASNGHIRLCRLLVERGADLHAKNKKGRTPLDNAAVGVAPYLLDLNLPIPESSTNPRVQPRARDDKKPLSTESKKCTTPPTSQAPPTMETSTKFTSQSTTPADDPYEFKASKADQSTSSSNQSSTSSSQEQSTTGKGAANEPGSQEGGAEQIDSAQGGGASEGKSGDDGNAKRTHEEEGETDEESKRKKRKEETKEKTGGTPVRNTGQAGKTVNKPPATPKSLTPKPPIDRKSPSPKPPTADLESDDSKSDLKVPPLKIVIPQSASEQDGGGGARNGKGGTQRAHQALPYVVPSGGEEGKEGEKEGEKKDEKKDGGGSGTDDQKSAGGHHQRVLRSHRGPAQSGVPDRSTPSSPLSNTPSPNDSPAAPPTTDPPTSQPSQSTSSTKQSTTDSQPASNTSSTSQEVEPERKEQQAPPTGTGSKEQAAPVELHPRKRKLRPSKELSGEEGEKQVVNEVHPHDQPITNCYQLYLNIRKQIERRRKSLFPVQPKPPQGFKDYLMNRCTYVLAGTASTVPNINHPASLPTQMKEIFTEQEKERYKLRMQHVIEKEKLVLSVEQEILRVHGRAARALANQSLPFSVCTVLRDEEVYNIITPEQEEKNSQRSRYNGRLFLSWLQDVDDKWEKIKEAMLLRHHNEAESLHAVQKMDWEWKLKELSLCDYKVTPHIDDLHVPSVHVSDDFDLLPA